MQRHVEYTDEDGKRWTAMQNYIGTDRRDANNKLSHLATVKGWTKVEVFKEDMPPWEIKKRINAVQVMNGNPPLYEGDELKPPELRKTIILTDHHDGSTIEVVQPTSLVTVVNPPIEAALTPIIDHAVTPVAAAPAQTPPNIQTVQSTVPTGGAQG